MTSPLIDGLRQLLAVNLLIISAAAVAAPFLSAKIKKVFIPSIVFELMLGILIGPQVFNLVQPIPQMEALSTIGLTLLIFLVGFEIDLQYMKGRLLLLASACWLTALLVAGVLAAGMMKTGLILEVAIVSLALTTTALGALLPILQDTKTSGSRFGMLVLAVGAVSQFAPILMISLLFTASNPVITCLFLAVFIVIAVASAFFLTRLHQLEALQFVRDHFHLSTQLPIRVAVLLIFSLVCLAIKLKLNVLLGAFSAGIVLRLFTAKQDRALIDSKLKAIGYSFLIPLFFIVSGMNFDIHALASLGALGRMFFFLVCLLLVRVVPVFLFLRNELDGVHRQALVCFSATTLPLIVVITHLGLMTGQLLPINAVALVGAGVLSVLLFPILGLNRLQKAQ